MTESEVKYKAKYDNGRSFTTTIITCDEHLHHTIRSLQALYLDVDVVDYTPYIPAPNTKLRHCQQCKRIGKIWHEAK